jgi:hypothetical protein
VNSGAKKRLTVTRARYHGLLGSRFRAFHRPRGCGPGYHPGKWATRVKRGSPAGRPAMLAPQQRERCKCCGLRRSRPRSLIQDGDPV